MADRVGQQLGNYQLIQLLGQGSLAEVYLGGHIHIGTLAAIKVLHAQLKSEDIAPFQWNTRGAKCVECIACKTSCIPLKRSGPHDPNIHEEQRCDADQCLHC